MGAAAAESLRSSDAVVITTERLLLRCWRPSDAELFHRHCNTSAVMHWLGGVQSKRELFDDVQYFIESHEENGFTFWVIERRSDGAFLGFCGFLTDVDDDSTVKGEMEIGWRVRADEWRNGYAEEAARACIDWAFSVLKPRRIVSRAAESNLASRSLMGKLGMRHGTELDYTPDDGSERLVVYTMSKRQAQAALKR